MLSKMKQAVVSIHVMFSFCTFVQKVDSINHTSTVGQDVLLPCGINSMENVTRLVWKYGQSVRDSEQLAFSYDGEVACDKSKKDCDLRDNGDLVIHNVKEVDSNDRYFCFLNDEKYYAVHTLNVLPQASPPSFEKCPEVVSVSKPDSSSQRLLAYNTPICRNSEDVLGSVTCKPPSGTMIDSNLNKVVCNCTYAQGYADTCEMTIPVLPPSFTECPVSNGVSVSKLDDASLKLLAYATPVCRNPDEVLGIVTCNPQSGAKINSSYSKVVCNCTYSGDHSDTCEMVIPVDRCGPGFAKITGQGFATGFGVCAFIVILVTLVVFIWWYMKNKKNTTSTEKSPSTNGSSHSSSQKKTSFRYERSGETGEAASVLLESETATGIIGRPTDAYESTEADHTQIARTTEEVEQEETQEGQQSVISADGQTIGPTQAHGVQPDSEPLSTQANIQPEETIQEDHGVQSNTELSALQENQSPRPISAIKVTSPPQFQNPLSGYDTVDRPEDAKPVIMNELMLDFESGPRIKLLPLKDILSDGMEIRSSPDRSFRVIRKSEEKYDVHLSLRKDGHHWDILAGDQSFFYISCGCCHSGCFLVEMSGGNIKQMAKKFNDGH